MEKLLYYFKKIDPFIRFILLGMLTFQIVMVYPLSSVSFIVLLLADGILIFFEINRLRPTQRSKYSIGEMLFSLFLSTVIMLISGMDYIQIYYFFLLDNIFNTPDKKARHWLLGIHLVCLLGEETYIALIKEHEKFVVALQSAFILFIFYCLFLLLFAIIHYFKAERERLKKINLDLLEYSFEQQDYITSEERNRISQELHDSIGHSLMAALMNVRYLKAIKDKGQKEKNEQINEIENLLKECITNLRESVYTIKELGESIDLYSEIQRIIAEFDKIGVTEITLSYDNQIDQSSNIIKKTLFKSLREAVTNSMKHGNATKIRISIQCVGNKIKLVVQDNGSGCSDIHESYGLKGIIERAEKIGGNADFESSAGNGFTLSVTLPGGGQS